MVTCTSPSLDPFTNHRPRQPCAPHDHTCRSIRRTSTIDDRWTLAANAQPPIPIRMSSRSDATVTLENLGPDNSGAVRIRIHSVNEIVKLAEVRLMLIGTRPDGTARRTNDRAGRAR